MRTRNWPNKTHAHPLIPYKGQKFYRVPVDITQSTLFARAQVRRHVIAPSAEEAANLVRDEIASHVERPTEITAYGPGGGKTHRFIGWESMIGAKLFESRPKQVQLLFDIFPQNR